MADIGLNQNITVRNRKFHFQTTTNLDDGLIRTEVFEQGRVLYTELNKYERRDISAESGADLRLRRLVDQFHRSAINGLETLFELSHIIARDKHALSHHRLGAIFLSLHLFDKAEENLLAAIDIEPDNPSIYISLSKCYYYQKRYKHALQTIQPLLKKQIEFPDLYNLAGLLLLEQKNYMQALNHFRHAIKLNANYLESYYNMALTIFQRIDFLKLQQKNDEILKNLDFLKIIFSKIQKNGDDEDRQLIRKVLQAFSEKKIGIVHSLVYDFRNKTFFQRIPSSTIGYEFYLLLRYLPERLDEELLLYFDQKISQKLEQNQNFADMWSYLALIHLMQCRAHFLDGLENFKAATKLNPRFEKAKKNLRLVENDGREFLSLIKAVVND